MEFSERAEEADEALRISLFLEDYGREFAGRSEVDPGCRSEGMAFFSSSGCCNDEAASVFLMALRRDEARENNVEELKGGARPRPAHALPPPTCHPLFDSATTTVFLMESKVGMEYGVGLRNEMEYCTETPSLEAFSLLLFSFRCPAFGR